MSENTILDRLAAEIQRLKKQRDATAVRIEQVTQRIEKLQPYEERLAAKASPGSAVADAEREHAKEAHIQEGSTGELPQSAASKPSKMIKKVKARRGKEGRPSVQRRRYGYC